MTAGERVPVRDRFGQLWRERGDLPWLALIVLLGFILRIIRLGTHSFWLDEVHNLLKGENLSAVILRGDLVSNHPPLFPGLVALWRSIGPGPTEWWMRSLSLTLGLCAIVALYILGKQLFGARAGLFAAFLLAISPFHVLHSQDLKEYIVLPFTGVVMVYCLYLATDRNRPGLWVLYAIMAAVACYSDFFAGPLLVGVNLWFFLQLRGRLDRIRGWILANVAGALLFLPQVGIMLQKVDNIMLTSKSWLVPKPNPWSVVFFVKTIAFGYSNLEPHFKIALFVFCAFALAGIVLSWKQNWRPALLLILWFAIPVTMVYVVSQFTQSIFLIRALLPYALPFYLWVGLAISRIERRVLRSAAALGFACIAAFPLVQKYQGIYSLHEFPHRPGTHAPIRYREAAHAVLRNWQEGDMMLHAGNWSCLPFYWYGFREMPRSTYQSVTTDTSWIKYFQDANPSVTNREEIDAVYPLYVQNVVEGRSRLWFVFSEWEREYLKNTAVPTWRWLDAHYPEIDHMDFGNFEVFLYASELNGLPVHVTARDQDDGVTATMTYAGGFEGTYVKHKADLGLVPSPPEARRGNLTLRFDEETAAQPVPFTQDPEPRTVSFAIENRADKEVACRVEFMVSDYLLDVASLYETRPESDVWGVCPMANPAPPPDGYETPTAVARRNPHESATLRAMIDLSPGTYETLAYLFCHSSDYVTDLHVAAGEQTLLSGLPPVSAPDNGWQWWTTSPLSVDSEKTGVPIRITAGPVRGGDRSEVSLAHIGFRKMSDTREGKTTDQMLLAWPGEVILPPSSTTRWSAEIDSDAGRVDVWVYERGTDGRAYRIFRILRD